MKFLLLFTFLSTLSIVFTEQSLKIENVDRVIDLTSQLAKVSVKLTLKNTGNAPVNTFQFVPNPLEKGTIAFISARELNKRDLIIRPMKNQADDGARIVRLTQDLQKDKTVIVNIEYVLIKSLVPHPASVTQREHQLVRFYTTQNFYSQYPIRQDKTTLKLSSSNVESYTKTKTSVQSDSTISYGPVENVAPLTSEEIFVHFENDTPFLTVTELTRTVEVSHWGNIAIEETVDMSHTGATLKGPFSRYEYQRDGNSGQNSIKSFKTILPASATGAYYRDTNGNISTSHMRVKKDAVELNLRPRYPLFGGWKTRYTLGYNVPSYEYLYHSGDEYLLKMRAIDHVFDDMIVEKVTTRIILPEGSTNIVLNTPYRVERHMDSLHYTYLDIRGRPVISFTKTDAVENHIQDFELTYDFPRLLMLQEPILVFVAFYLLFLLVIIYVRLDFSIYKKKTD